MRVHCPDMAQESTPTEFGRLYAEIYSYCYRRSSPRGYHISQESLMLLQHLDASGPLTVKEAAKHFDRSQAAMSEMLERLVTRGQLAKVVDQRDRRRHLVWLTDEGHNTLRNKGRPLSEKRLEQALTEMRDSDTKALMQGIRSLSVALRKLSPTQTSSE